MKLQLLCFLALVFISTNFVAADDTNLAPWPIVQRCLPAPIIPDKNWSYDGEILMHGWAGIHGIRAGSQMPYVVHWGDGLLSPNGQWVLTQKLVSHTEQSDPRSLAVFVYNYSDIEVENLTSRDKIKFPWQAILSITSGPYPVPPAGPIWLDNNHFVSFYDWDGYKTREGNLETGEITDRPDIDLQDYEYSISPDQTRFTSFGSLYNLSNNQILAQEQVGIPYDMMPSVWTQDSSIVADLVRGEDNAIVLSILDRDGKVISKPFVNHEGAIRLGKFSAGNDYFWFTANNLNIESHPYILDMRKHVIYDLCFNHIMSLAWSPDGTQFATILGEGQQPIVVVDINDWQPYIVGYHTGSVLLWRSES